MIFKIFSKLLRRRRHAPSLCKAEGLGFLLLSTPMCSGGIKRDWREDLATESTSWARYWE